MYSKETNTKVCPKCGVPKDASKEFYQRRGGGPGSYCKICTRGGLEAWARENPQQDRESRRRATQTEGSKVSRRNYKYRQRDAVIEKLGGKCAWLGCGWTDPRALQIDHKRGGGLAERRELKGDTIALYKRVLADTTDKYQLLCANHNRIKVYENLEGVRSDHPLASQLPDTSTDAVHF